MPTYQYRCTECGNELEARQKFSDAPLTVCPNCSGELRKVYNAVGIVFKGSGFYATDNRSKHKGAKHHAESKSDDSSKSTDAPKAADSAKKDKPKPEAKKPKSESKAATPTPVS